MVKFVLFLECGENVCIQRCLQRGATGFGRLDDNEEVLKRRFNTYINSTMPIVEYYRKKNLVHDINANQSVEEVYAEIKKMCDF